MESVFRHILKSLFDEFVTGLDENVEFSKSMLNLWDLKVKENKVHEIFADFTGAPVEFSTGRIDAMQLKMSLYGEIECVLSNVVLNLAFTPLKALKQAILPEPAQPDGIVLRIPHDLRREAHWNAVLGGRQQATPPPTSVPRYCPAHGRKKLRPTTDVHETQCERCKVRLQTNFLHCTLCAPCSMRESRCLLCGESILRDGETSMPTDGFAYAMQDIRNPEYFQKMLDGGPAPYQVPPRFCRFHQRPERRTTGETRMTECMMCKARLQTNYEELSLCAPCSTQENGCMLCGAYLPPGNEGGVAALQRPKTSTIRRNSSTQALPRGGPRMKDTSRASVNDDELEVDNIKDDSELVLGNAVSALPAQSDPLPYMLQRRHSGPFKDEHDDDTHLPAPSDIVDTDVESEAKHISTPPNEPADPQDAKTPPHAKALARSSHHDDFGDLGDEDRTGPIKKITHGPKGAGASKERPKTHHDFRKKWHIGHAHESSDHLLVPAPKGSLHDLGTIQEDQKKEAGKEEHKQGMFSRAAHSMSSLFHHERGEEKQEKRLSQTASGQERRHSKTASGKEEHKEGMFARASHGLSSMMHHGHHEEHHKTEERRLAD